MGEYLYQSHHGMRYEYEITVPEIDLLVDFTKQIPAVIGSRMMGGGFGGCTINFIHQDEKAKIIEEAKAFYQKKTGKDMSVYEVKIGEGVHLLTI